MARKPYPLRTAAVFVLMFFLCECSFGQEGNLEARRTWILALDAGISRGSVKDAYFSLIPNNGYLFTTGVSASTEGDRGCHNLEMGVSVGTLDAAKGNTSLKQTQINASYTYLFKLNERASGFQIRPGAAVNAFYVRREYNDFINNNKAFDFAASFSLAVHAAYFFSRKDDWSIGCWLYIPVISLVDQTAFGTESTSIGVDPGLQSFSSFFRVLSKLEVKKQFSEHHHVSLGYGWDFYHISSLREVQQATHSIRLKYGFNF